MASAIEKYWFAVGFWHRKINQYTPPSAEEIEYIKDLSNIDINQEYEKGYKAAQ